MAKPTRKPKKTAARPEPQDTAASVVGLRIIGGQFRGRKLQYSGDLRTRPMKDRLREAIFNLVGPTIRGKHAVDLFAGTGALALEAISRGAAQATLVEQHFPTAAIIRLNAATLGIEQRVEVIPGNTFIWWQKQATAFASGTSILPADMPWAVFCSPPYAFFVDRTDEMLELIAGMMRLAPANSVFVVETDARFDFQTLPDPQAWDVRAYEPAFVGIFFKDQ